MKVQASGARIASSFGGGTLDAASWCCRMAKSMMQDHHRLCPNRLVKARYHKPEQHSMKARMRRSVPDFESQGWRLGPCQPLQRLPI